MTPAFEEANSKLLDVVSIAESDIDAEVKSVFWFWMETLSAFSMRLQSTSELEFYVQVATFVV